MKKNPSLGEDSIWQSGRLFERHRRKGRVLRRKEENTDGQETRVGREESLRNRASTCVALLMSEIRRENSPCQRLRRRSQAKRSLATCHRIRVDSGNDPGETHKCWPRNGGAWGKAIYQKQAYRQARVTKTDIFFFT